MIECEQTYHLVFKYTVRHNRRKYSTSRTEYQRFKENVYLLFKDPVRTAL
jgi:hypothetical protein